ncbi:MAG: hypothetical protein GX947_03275 [Tissierellia bacterium]|nr:hypothetical protein [Tissierellia bacterium]
MKAVNVLSAKRASREIILAVVERQIFIESFHVVMVVTGILLVCGIMASLNKKQHLPQAYRQVK